MPNVRTDDLNRPATRPLQGNESVSAGVRTEVRHACLLAQPAQRFVDRIAHNWEADGGRENGITAHIAWPLSFLVEERSDLPLFQNLQHIA